MNKKIISTIVKILLAISSFSVFYFMGDTNTLGVFLSFIFIIIFIIVLYLLQEKIPSQIQEEQAVYYQSKQFENLSKIIAFIVLVFFIAFFLLITVGIKDGPGSAMAYIIFPFSLILFFGGPLYSFFLIRKYIQTKKLLFLEKIILLIITIILILIFTSPFFN